MYAAKHGIRCIFMSILLLAAASTAAADSWQLIDEGRAACARDDHEEAIRLYRLAIEEDPSLFDSIAVSLGSQLTWADRHDEAIDTFQRFLAKHPTDPEALLSLALAQYWSDRLGDALATYRRLLRLDPHNLDAAFGEARMLAWQGKLDASLAWSKRLLRRHPGFGAAAANRAMVVDWIGDHRRAAGLYSAILRDEPRNIEHLKGRAHAWYGAGLPDRAAVDLKEALAIQPDAKEAVELLRTIRQAWSPGARGSVDLLLDSDDFRRIGSSITVEYPLAYRTRPRFVLRRNDYSKPGRPTTADLWAGVEGEARLTETHLIYGAMEALISPPVGVHGTRGIGHGHLAWLPNDRIRLDSGYSRTADFTYERSPDRSVRYLDADIVDLGLTARPYWRTILTIGLDRGWFADGNRRINTRARLRHDLLLKPRLRLEAGFHWLDYEVDRGGGLWTPSEFRSLLLAPELEWAVGEGLLLSGRIETGTAGERNRATRAHLTILGGARLRRGALDLELRIGRADADVETGRGYRRSFGTLTVGFRLP